MRPPAKFDRARPARPRRFLALPPPPEHPGAHAGVSRGRLAGHHHRHAPSPTSCLGAGDAMGAAAAELDECPICLGALGGQALSLGCGHCFCAACLLPTLAGAGGGAAAH